MKKVLLAVMTLLFLGATGMVMADTTAPAPGVGTRTPRANHRMRNQRKRIRQGVKSGQLTKDETKTLATDHKALRQEIKDAKSDGKVTKEERKQIQKDENAESKKIYDLKHNDTKRDGAK